MKNDYNLSLFEAVDLMRKGKMCQHKDYVPTATFFLNKGKIVCDNMDNHFEVEQPFSKRFENGWRVIKQKIKKTEIMVMTKHHNFCYLFKDEKTAIQHFWPKDKIIPCTITYEEEE